VSKSLKIINAQLPSIMKKKGCDASNIYDEEVPEQDQDYSDDDKEKHAKKARK
jgi:H/ACA ribonucleoprotein complex non-core subunit NAF1